MKGSLVGRSVVALGLMVLFYALAIVAAIGLGYLGLWLFSHLGEVRGRGLILVAVIGVACLGAAAVIVWSVLPRVDEFEPPGPELFRESAPELFAEIERLGEATGQRVPRHVYLIPAVNAFVTERGGAMGIGSRRVMGIGLPLLGLLTVSELRAVLAHELGHFYGGDTKLGPWIYKTRGAVGRTVFNLARASESTESDSGYIALISFIFAAVQKPFLWFGTLFLRITQAISRAQEHSADALAARIVGARPLVAGLRKVVTGGPAYSAYFDGELAPLVRAGFRPPVVAGFTAFLGAGRLDDALADYLTGVMESTDSDPYDSHPPLRDRIAALESMVDSGSEEPDARLAIELVSDPARLERELLEMVADRTDLEALDWDEALERVFIPEWRQGLIESAAFERIAFDQAPDHLDRLAAQLVLEIGDNVDDVPDDVVAGWATNRIASAMALRLIDRGFEAIAGPGAPIVLRNGDLEIEPWVEVRALIERDTTASGWRARCAELELAGAAINDVSS